MEIFKKKKLFCFLFLFFAFIPFISVNAEDNYLYINYDDEEFQTILTSSKIYLDDVMAVIKEYEEKDPNYHFKVEFNTFSSSTKFGIRVYSYYGTATDVDSYNIFKTYEDNIVKYGFQEKRNYNNAYYLGEIYYIFGDSTSSKHSSRLSTMKTTLDNYTNKTLYSNELITTSNTDLRKLYFDTDNIASSYNEYIYVYYNTFEYNRKVKYADDFGYKLVLNGTVLENGDYIQTIYDYIVIHPFEELIPTSLYKGLVFSFNTSNVTSNDTLSFNYNFYSSDENYNVLDTTFEIPYFGYNGKDIYSDGSYTLNYQTNQLDAIPKNNYINDNFLQNFKYFESDYKLFVNFEMLEDNYFYAYLNSPLQYDVEYIEREENLYYFDEVDITGKYGVVFIPNDITNDYVSVMKFSEKGKYSVQLRDSYSETNENYNILEYYQIGFCDNLDVTGLVPVNCVDSYFLSLNNYFREKKQFVYVKNENNYDSSVKSVITYDTRYYTAYIQEYSNSNIEISNPNTGETDIFGPMTDFDNVYYEISNENILELMHTFLEDLQQTSDTFNYMWNNFYSIMPDILKAFLQVITHLLCIWVFMKIVGYD